MMQVLLAWVTSYLSVDFLTLTEVSSVDCPARSTVITQDGFATIRFVSLYSIFQCHFTFCLKMPEIEPQCEAQKDGVHSLLILS